ncbi:aminomethyl-transferring glycine dehydrogenase [Gryllotalpicola sp.]|uniref:aminomethyl-transferring glycine dehydrogenase n=1 Tax=Gryllotalpicola sp. TaxID=1932787 RepID=UPI002613FF73|nr:aminomethyl-transferring glycine dehydrogenase [Gryllotalpicola sp.]
MSIDTFRSTFADRHIGADSAQQAAMLAAVGYGSLDELVRTALPEAIQLPPIDPRRAQGFHSLPRAASERQALAELRAIAARNTVNTSLIGQGYYGTITPAVIQRNVLENPSWYTAYTPYQPEISQGRLEALINFQQVVVDLTGLDIANASMLDESTAVAEGMLLARRASKSASAVFLVDEDAFPQTKALLEGRAAAVGIELHYTAYGQAPPADLDVFGAFIQYPGASGRVWDPREVIAAVKAQSGLVVMAADLLALALIASPGELGADIAVGSSQRFGVPMGFGGPHAGYLAVRSGLERQLPGRLVGVSQDAAGKPAYRLTLQTREQHIRREKATSNICTAQVLLAVMASMYAVYHGPRGIRAIAQGVHRTAIDAKARLQATGVDVVDQPFFDTLTVLVPGRAAEIADAAHAAGILYNVVDAGTLRLSFDETFSADPELVDRVLAPLGVAPLVGEDAGTRRPASPIPDSLRRTSAYLEHPVFNSYHSETAMMRYLKQLADRDYALDRGMIPLGSCTMKLNAASEMAAVTWPEFADIHPFAPASDVAGYLELIGQLEIWLAELTGYDTVSLQPNAGSQGELSGLLAIRGYHLARGDAQRTVCLIPQSAHGTNAASAVLAGLRVVVVATDADGNVDLVDLRAKIAEHADEIAALMITYPSTHGVYEHDVVAIADAVHAAGGQVYVDGANLNALVGYAKPGAFGGDVSHLNLHKTFCIPHGGGGPGVGPVAAKAHLAPFLPGHPLAQSADHPGVLAATGTGRGDGLQFDGGARPVYVHGGAPVSAAPYGSPSILPISWAYVRMMGADGLARATGSAVLAANYVAAKLHHHYPVLYAGEGGLVAHECILDLRPLTAETGVTVDDVAKRLVDYGFHAPTMSFPVAGTLMVEPTESEDLGELDRFVAAMIAIRREAERVAQDEWPADDNPLHNAPHTAESVVSGEWEHPYSRELAVFPAGSAQVRAKYWPPVRRIDNAWGDRNLFCACPPVEAFA